MIIFFRTLSVLINIYMMLCFIRIMLTWIPGISYSPIARFLSSLCDPFLSMFSHIRWLHISNLDLTPVVALGVLVALSTIFGNIAAQHRFFIGGILAVIVSVAWSLISSILGFLVLFLVIRLLVMLFSGNSGYSNSIWSQIDYALNPIVFRISGFFSNGKPISYKNALIVSIITLIVFMIAGRLITGYFSRLLQMLPF